MTEVQITTFPFDVALSYASEDRPYVQIVAEHLRARGTEVFYDEFEKVDTWGAELPELFIDIFQKKARLAVAFISTSYVSKPWPMHEGRSALARALVEHEPYFLPVRLDDSELPGLRPSVGYIDAKATTPEELAGLILRKLERLPGRSASDLVYVEAPLETSAESRSKEGDAKLRAAVSRGDDLYIVLDLGGTKAYVAIMNSEAEILYHRREATKDHNDPALLFEFIKTCIRFPIDTIHEVCGVRVEDVPTKIRALGVAFPGPTNYETGSVLDAPNFQIKDFPLRDRLQSYFEIKPFVENDVNLAVLGEAWKGAAKGYANIVGIMIGTGIGGGIIINGRLYRGRNKTAGELGHMVLNLDSDKQCGCLQFGCLEALASRRAMARDLRKRKSEQDIAPDILDSVWDEDSLGSNQIARYYNSGDADAVAVVSRAAEICGKAVFSILNVFNPEIIVFNGGFVRQLGDVFLEPVRKEAGKCMNAVYSLAENTIPIEVGALPNPVLVGACKMAIDGSASRKQYDKSDLISTIVGGLGERDRRILGILHRNQKPAAIVEHPSGLLFKENLRALRDRGLIRTLGGRSLGNSEFIEVTQLGRIVVQEEDL